MKIMSTYQFMERMAGRNRNIGFQLPENIEAVSGGKKTPSFAEMMNDAVNGVNSLQHESTEIIERMMLDPDSVDTHDVTISMAKANMALSMTKAVVERGLKAYKEIINIR